MNVELKPIAESKVRQLGGDVCGVLVRNEAGAWAAVSEGGRVMWLDDFEGQPSSAQGGRGADAVKWSDPAVDPIVSKLYRKFKEWNRQGFGADDVTWCEVRGYVAELLNTQPQPAVPEGWRECLAEMVQAMHDYEMSVDEDAPYKHRAMMDRAHALLSATPQPEGKPDTVYWYFEGSEQDSLETLHKDVRVVISAGTLKGLLDGSPKQGSVPEDVIRQCEDAIQYASEIRGGCISGVREAQKRVRAILDTPQTAVPDGEERLTDIYRRQLFECQDALNNLRSEYHNRTAELETEIEDLHEELQRVRRQADVPEGWRECLAEMVQAMHDYEMRVDEDAPYKHRAMMDRAHALLSTTPQADGWVRCDERLPTEEDWWVWIYDSEDGDIFHALWRDLKGDYENGHMNLSHWMPTGLKRPQPPKEGA